MHAVAMGDSGMWRLGRRPALDGLRSEYSLRNAATAGLLVGMWVGGPLYVWRQFSMYHRLGWLGIDCHAYWLTGAGPLYSAPPHTRDAYLYSPAFAQVIRPLTDLPFPWFYALFAVIDVACVAWLLWPLGWRWTVPLLMLDAHEFVLGQVIGLLTVCAVVGVLGRSGFWSFPWLTKVAPGMLGVVWHGVRGEWRNLGMALLWPAVLALVSAVLWPAAWLDWLRFLRHSAHGDPTATIRLVLAVMLVALGARLRWRWVVPVALLLGAPVVGPQSVTYLAGVVRLRRRQANIAS